MPITSGVDFIFGENQVKAMVTPNMTVSKALGKDMREATGGVDSKNKGKYQQSGKRNIAVAAFSQVCQ